MKTSLIFLTGLMGAGKTTLGRLLARELGADFCDMDAEIVLREGREIPELFARGEAVFRDAETRACRALCRRKNLVVACGGGAILREENVHMMRGAGAIVFLDRPVENILGDVDPSNRPLLAQGRERLLAIRDARDSLYRASADCIVKNDSSQQEGLNRLLQAVQSIWEAEK